MSGWAWLGIAVVAAWTLQIVGEFLLAYRRVCAQERRDWESDIVTCLRDIASRGPLPPNLRGFATDIDGKLYGPVQAEAVWAAMGQYPWSGKFLDKVRAEPALAR